MKIQGTQAETTTQSNVLDYSCTPTSLTFRGENADAMMCCAKVALPAAAHLAEPGVALAAAGGLAELARGDTVLRGHLLSDAHHALKKDNVGI